MKRRSHGNHPISQLLNLPLDGRLADLRVQGRRSEVSATTWSIWNVLSDLGLEVDPPVGGRPNVRGQSGCPIKWGDGWFGPIRDGGGGWSFDKHARPEIQTRVDILMQRFKRNCSNSMLPLQDVMLAIES